MYLRSTLPVLLIIAAVIFSSSPTVSARSSQSFSDAVEEFLNNLRYELTNIGLLRDSSYSEENNKDFGILARSHSSSSFSLALETLQKHLNYKFQNIWYLRRAMTHSSYSDENNKDLSIIGLGIINATVARDTFTRRLNSSSKAVNDRLSMTNNENVCATYGTFLRLESVVRVSASFDSSNSSILSGAFKALLGAIALDSGKIADAEKLFLGILDGASKVIVYYQFKNRELHLRALTHSSYSKENNKALSILGESIIETFAAMRSLTNDLYKSARESRDFNKIVKEAVVNKISKEAVEDCALSGKKLRLHEKVMVSSSTDASNPSVVCGAFKSMVGATALDSGEPDKAVNWMLVSLRGAFALDFPESD